MERVKSKGRCRRLTGDRFFFHWTHFSHYSLILILITTLFVFTLAEESQVYYLRIDGTIDIGLAAFTERAVSEANSTQVKALLIEINTFGGRIDAATRIKDALLSARPLTIIYVNRRAISAGALISLAADQLVMAPGSSIGAATAVDLEGKKVSEKVQSFMRSEMRSTAEKTGRNPDVAQAMVDERLTIPGLTDSTTLVTLTAREAVQWGIADTVINNLSGVLNAYGLQEIPLMELRISWAERMVRFLSHPIVSSMLLTLGFLGLLFEIKSPGWGVPGTVGLICLALFFGASYIAQLASLLEILIFLAGITLLVLEATVIPGFGIAGIAGIILTGWGFFMMLLSKHPTANEINRAVISVGLSFILLIIFLFFFFKHLPRTKIWQKLTLGTVLDREKGVSSETEAVGYVGRTGVALNDLRPAGKIRVGNNKFDVVTKGEYVEKGRSVRIIKVVGNRIVVRKELSAKNKSKEAS